MLSVAGVHSARRICAIIVACVCWCMLSRRCPSSLLSCVVIFCSSKKAFITLCSPVVPLLSTSKADSGLASEFRRDRAIYTAYERMLKAKVKSECIESREKYRTGGDHRGSTPQHQNITRADHTHKHKHTQQSHA
jgi:hypothetical protein